MASRVLAAAGFLLSLGRESRRAAQRPCPHRRSNGSKNRTKAFAKERTSCNAFARSLGYKISQLQALDALYEQRRKVDPALVLKVRYESMQLDEAGTLATVARFLGVDGLTPPKKQTCWHDCGTRKSVFSITESLRIQLEVLYAPSQRRFEDLIRAGRVADLS